MWQTTIALCAVLGLIVLIRMCLPWVLQRLGVQFAPGPQRTLRVLETVSLGAKQRLHIVEAEGRRLLVSASTDGAIALLARLGESEGQADTPSEVPDTSESAQEEGGTPRLRMATGVASRLVVGTTLLVGLTCFDMPAFAAPPPAVTLEGAPATLSISLNGAASPERISSTLQVVALLTLLSVAPSVVLMATCFTRILIVLSLLRQAMGSAQLPPNQIIVGLALFTTIYVMSPVGEEIYANALTPYMNQEIGGPEALERALPPARNYLLRHTREKDLELFVELSGKGPVDDLSEIPLATLMPAYLISEIRTSFQIGFTIYLPFVIIDLVIASMLISLGMIMLPPMIISLPFKLMLFVLLDGWNLVLNALVTGLV